MTASARNGIVGPVYSTVEPVLKRQVGYTAFRAGLLGQDGWNRLVDNAADELMAAGLRPTDLPFMKRFPQDPEAMIRDIVEDLERRGILPAGGAGQDAAEIASGPCEGYDHGGFCTFIYPEEGRLLAAACAASKPRHSLFLGSYYGYWASFAAPHIASNGGGMTLVDPDQRVCAVAARNFTAMGYGASVQIVQATGEAFLADAAGGFDLVVIDAETPRDHPVPSVRGKRVYRGLLEASLPKMTDDSMLVCHNILFADHTGAPDFDAIIERSREELGPFMALADRHFDFVEYKTTEGVGIGRRRPSVR